MEAAMGLTRRGLFGLISGMGGAVVMGNSIAQAAGAKPEVVAPVVSKVSLDECFDRTLRELRGRLGRDVFESWFLSMHFVRFADGVLVVSVPAKFLQSWLSEHYLWDLSGAAVLFFEGLEEVRIDYRKPRYGGRRITVMS